MAQIKGAVTVTPQEESLLNATFLVKVNAERKASGLSTFANMDAYADFILANALASYVSGVKEKKAKDVGDKYDAASPAVQAQVDALLG